MCSVSRLNSVYWWCLLLLFVHCVEPTSTLGAWNILISPSGVVPAGENMTVTCSNTAAGYHMQKDPPYISRTIKGTTHMVVQVNHLLDKFKNDDRYKVKLDIATWTLTLAITDVSGEDRGRYTCGGNSNHHSVEEYVRIAVPITTIQLLYRSTSTHALIPLSDSGVLPVSLDEDFPEIQCVVVIINEDTETYKLMTTVELDQSDITDQFTGSIDRKQDLTGGYWYEDFLLKFTSHRHSFVPSLNYQGQSITCESHPYDLKSYRKRTRATIDVIFRPRVSPDADHRYINLPQQNVQVTYMVQANPKPEKIVWTWNTLNHTMHLQMDLAEGSAQTGDLQYQAFFKHSQGFNYTVKFIMKMVDRVDQLTSYNLTVQNNQGLSNHTFNLIEGQNTEHPEPIIQATTSGASPGVFLRSFLFLIMPLLQLMAPSQSISD